MLGAEICSKASNGSKQFTVRALSLCTEGHLFCFRITALSYTAGF